MSTDDDVDEVFYDEDGQAALFAPADDSPSRLPPTLVIKEPDATGRPPRIRSVWFRNFKGYESLSAELGNFNVLVGANNAGKSTLLQGVDLIFSLLKLHKEHGRLSASGRLVPPSILPVANLRDLFHKGVWRAGNKYVEAVLGVEFDDNSQIEFGIRHMFGNANSKLRNESGMEGERLANLLGRPAVWVPSAVGIVRDEEYRTSARRAGLITDGRHNEVLRNLLVALKDERPVKYALLQRILLERFGGELSDVAFDDAIDQFVSGGYSGANGAQHDLYSAGAGFIQVVQLLAFVLSRDVGVVLLDEPDAHLHSSLQRVVVEILDEISEDQGFQVVLATHSKEIINFVDPSRLIFIENGATKASPVSSAITPVTILRSLGAIDNVDAFALMKNRTCLFVEGSSDVAVLERFASTLGVRSFTGDDRVVIVPTSGADKFEHVQQLSVIEALIGGPLRSLQLRDGDGRIIPEREQLENASERPLQVWKRDCIESYLIEPVVIARVINDILLERAKPATATPEEIEEILTEQTQELYDHTVDRVASRYQNDQLRMGNRLSAAEANPVARDAVRESWATLDGRLSFVAGKRLLSATRRVVQDRWGVNFGNERLAEAFARGEVPAEVVDAIHSVQRLGATEGGLSEPRGQTE